MSDTLTILRSLDKPCTKHFELQDEELIARSKSMAFKFDVHEMDISGLSDLGGALSALEEDRQAVIIRGKSTDALPAFDVHRRQEQFESAPRQWCLIDIDELLIPEKFEDEMANINSVQNQEVAGLKMLLAQAAYNP
jgi:hypothetical protein